MSPISFILPVLTVVSLFLYVFSAERAWLPKMGTTEWITRASTPRRMTTDINPEFAWKDIVIFFGIIVVYGGLFSFYRLPLTTYDIIDIAYISVFSGIIYIFAQLLYKSRVTAFFATAMTAASLLLIVTFNNPMSSAAIILFVFFIIIAPDNIWAFIPAGIFLNTAIYHDSIYILFVLLALCPAVVTSARTKNGMPVLLYLIFCVVLSVVSFFLNPYWDAAWYYTGSAIVLAQPLYLIVSVVCLIINVIHIFKDKSYTALFISVGLIISFVCEFFGYHITPVFTGLAIAYPASIIIKRGKKRHKVFCIIFGSVMVLSFLTGIAYCALANFAPAAAETIIDALDFICPIFKFVS